jgi:hypothetical protein
LGARECVGCRLQADPEGCLIRAGSRGRFHAPQFRAGGSPFSMVKRPLTRIAYALGLRARPRPNGDRARDFGATPATPGPPWTHWSHRRPMSCSRRKRPRIGCARTSRASPFRRLRGGATVLRNLGAAAEVHRKSGDDRPTGKPTIISLRGGTNE